MTPPFHNQLLRDLREALTHHQIELEQVERYIRAGDYYSFDLRLQRDMHDRFVIAIGAAIELLASKQSLPIANAQCASC